MTEKKIIVVLGATGRQGGGLARAILADPQSEFAVRVVTRDPSSTKARELAARGAQIVAGDVDDLESLRRAFDGAYGAYCVTFFWDHFSPEKEVAHAQNMAAAARDARLQHVIWSTFEDTRNWVPLDDARMPTLQGRYKVPHFDAKAEADRAFEGLPVTYLLTSFYWENFFQPGVAPARGADGKLAITFPLGDARMPSIAVEDIGRCAYAIFRRGSEMIGRRVGVAGEHLSGHDMASAFSEVLGEEVRYNSVPPDVFRSFGFPGADDLGNMFQFKRDFERDYREARNLEQSRELNPALQTFTEWLQSNKARIPLS